MILIIDNYDSFTYNLVHYLMELEIEVRVERNDALSASEALAIDAAGYLLSPGPCTPDQAGISLDLVAACADAQKPLLGVCLGHQSIGQHFGGKVVQGGLMHGKTSPIEHQNKGIFEGLPSPFRATRYHSLVVSDDGLPDCLQVTARNQIANPQDENPQNDRGFIMGLQHQSLPLYGVQFHPESIATHHGHQLLANFIRLVGLEPKILADQQQR